MVKKIYVIAEHDGNGISPVTLEVLAFARQVGRALQSVPVTLVMAGDRLLPLARGMADQGISVLLLDVPGLTHYHSEIYKRIFFDFFNPRESALILTAHTARSMDFAPGLAVELKAAHISGVQGFEVAHETLNFLRTMDNGKRTAWVSPLTKRVVVSIRPGVCKPLKAEPGKVGEVFVRHLGRCREVADTVSLQRDGHARRIRFRGTSRTRTDIKGLSEAEVIVAAGNGIGSSENLAVLHEIAGFFHKSAVGGSRIVCDRGLLGYGQQVGITGAVVAPKLYMAWGISGSTQHVAGMAQSQFVVSINKDPTAPIMNVSDVCIIEDLNVFLPIYLKALTGKLDP